MKILLILTSLILFFSSTVNAADYYYCDCQAGASSQCVQGNDTNFGTISSPKQTFNKANGTFNTMLAGDSVNFCRGGSFTSNAKHRWVNNKCTAANVCTVTAYDLPGQESPQLSRPIITQQTANILFALEDGGNADHEEGYVFSNLDLRCTGCPSSGASGWAFFLYNDIDDVTIKDMSIDGFNIAVHLSGGNAPNPGSDGAQDNIILKNLRIVNNKNQGILGGAKNFTISNSYFENNGQGNFLEHNIYISRGTNIIIRNNELYRSALDSSGSCVGVSLVVHGVINNLLIENNIIREDIGKATPFCWGIAVDPAYSKAESFKNITIRGNKIINVGNKSIGIASCDTCIIENNIIIQLQAFGATAIHAPDRSRNSDDLPLDKITIRNNSIYTSATGTGIILGTEGSSHVVVNNAIHYTGTDKFTCINAGLAASAYTEIDNNVCYFPNASSSSEWESGSGTSPSPLGAWKASGFGSNSQYINPDFKDPETSADLSAKNSTSAIVNIGHSTLGAPKDARGKTRDSQPDVGAYEFGTFNPAAKTKIYFQ